MSQFLKSKILEYVTRRILFNCGFTSVISDGLYIYDRYPLQMINGKGAAHDADVLMNPPIQMPFAYPTRIIFECKAYLRNKKLGIDIVRNASGLRNDINDFEIITEDFLQQRQNNQRTLLAISDRKRHYYQVGISTLFKFSKPALEFAANNKIPLLSFSELFAGTGLADAIDMIPSNIEEMIGVDNYNALKNELLKKNINEVNYNLLSELMNLNEALRSCYEIVVREIDNVFVGILESGEILFIKKELQNDQNDILSKNEINVLKAQIHWNFLNPEIWWFNFNDTATRYYFYLPREIAKAWKAYNDLRGSALQIKGQSFAQFFIFNKGQNNDVMPFKLVTLDADWLQQMMNDQQ